MVMQFADIHSKYVDKFGLYNHPKVDFQKLQLTN